MAKKEKPTASPTIILVLDHARERALNCLVAQAVQNPQVIGIIKATLQRDGYWDDFVDMVEEIGKKSEKLGWDTGPGIGSFGTSSIEEELRDNEDDHE